MKVCLVSFRPLPGAELGGVAGRVATTLAGEHEVLVLHAERDGLDERLTPADSGVAEVGVDVDRLLIGTSFSCEEHRLAAAVLAKMREYYGDGGPDLVEAPDRRGLAVMALQARRCGAPRFAHTTFAVRLTSTLGIDNIHDGRSREHENHAVEALEREQLRLADLVVWPGGAGLDQYRDFYGLELAAAKVVPDPYPTDVPEPSAGAGEGPLRLLFSGPISTHSGALDLAEACLRLPLDDWTLTFSGPDTNTAPAGQSARLTIEALFYGDPRVRFVETADHDPSRLRAEHDVAVVAPHGGAWFDEAVVAARAGLPILATPVGGLSSLVEAGAGMLTEGVGPEPLRAAIARLVADPGAVRARARRERVQQAVLSFVDPAAARRAYAVMARPAGAPPRVAPAPTDEPLVTGVVPYYGASEYIRGAVASLLAQTYRNLEVLVVNDGSFGADDAVLDEFDDPRVRVVNQLNRGDGGARNTGIHLARGEYVALLDADNEMEPEFVRRAVRILGREPGLAYVSCWLRFMTPDGEPLYDPAGYAALGNGVVPGNDHNWDGDTLAVLPRVLFTELGYRFEPTAGLYSDWELYRRLRRDGWFGTVIPSYMARYRFTPESVSRGNREVAIRRSVAAARDRLRASATQWEAR
ncbi:MAG: glycosyltransferase [Solirubrobacterales bacterium]